MATRTYTGEDYDNPGIPHPGTVTTPNTPDPEEGTTMTDDRTHPNIQRVIDALTANPEPLIRWAAYEVVSLGAKREWDNEDNYNCTEGLVGIVGGHYDLPSAGDQGDDALRFYGEAALSLDWPTDYEPATSEVWLKFDTDDDDEASHEATVEGNDRDGYVVGWCHTAVGQVTERRFTTLAEAHAWLEGSGYADYTP